MHNLDLPAQVAQFPGMNLQNPLYKGESVTGQEVPSSEG